MQLNGVASTILVLVCVTALLISGGLNILLYLALTKANGFLESYRESIDPVLVKVDAVLSLATEKLGSVGSKTEAILTKSETLTDLVQGKVDKTATIVQRTVNAPIIGVNSVWAGVSRGFHMFGSLQRGTTSVPVDSSTDTEHSPRGVEAVRAVPVGPYLGREQ